MSTTQHDQAGGPGDQRADHGDGDQAGGSWWPAAAFSPHIGARALWTAARSGRIRFVWNRTRTRMRYHLGDVVSEWPHLIPENVHKRSFPSVDDCSAENLV